jgi:hypothetical protein
MAAKHVILSKRIIFPRPLLLPRLIDDTIPKLIEAIIQIYALKSTKKMGLAQFSTPARYPGSRPLRRAQKRKTYRERRAVIITKIQAEILPNDRRLPRPGEDIFNVYLNAALISLSDVDKPRRFFFSIIIEAAEFISAGSNW